MAFCQSGIEYARNLDFSNCYDINSVFRDCGILISVEGLNVSNVYNIENLFYYSSKIQRIDANVSGVTLANNIVNGCTSLIVIKLYGIGEKHTTWGFTSCLLWGTTDEESRQSVIYTLLTHSYDRAANGLSAGKITLHANTKAVLTEEEIAAITAKGYTIA